MYQHNACVVQAIILQSVWDPKYRRSNIWFDISIFVLLQHGSAGTLWSFIFAVGWQASYKHVATLHAHMIVDLNEAEIQIA